MDETASAIARLREAAMPEKASKADRVASDVGSPQGGPARGGISRRNVAQVAAPAATKRQKSGGG